jgi:Na+/H+ antiporter NhaC
VDHVKTQLPYALTVALASSLGYVVAGFVGSPLVLFLALGFLVLLVLLFGRLWGQKLV